MSPPAQHPWRPLPWGTALSGALLLLVGLLTLAPTPAPNQPPLLVVAQPDQDTGSVECVITRRDGREISGIFVDQDSEQVVVRVSGVRTAIPRAQIQRVEYLPPVEDRYEELRATIADNDVEGLLYLAEWLRRRERYDLALTEVSNALKAEPYNEQGKAMRAWLEQQIKLGKRAPAPRTDGRPSIPGRAAAKPFPTLSKDEINLIRVYEVDLRDPPRILIGRDVIERFMQEYAHSELIPVTRDGRESFLRAPPARILDVMFRLQARAYYPEVKVLDDPESMRLWKRNVHAAWLNNACASARCHGGEHAGRLWLQNKHVNSDATAYTNFLILDRFRLPDGTPLIDWDDPARSPLLQMALSRSASLTPHPDVGRGPGSRGWRPVFRSTEDRRFQLAVEWIRSMYRPRPEYPIDYQPPLPSGVEPLDGEPAPPVER
ncbi:MAG: hypothetical protein ACIARR_01440 [Phycisphaerales bacterium JB059]